MHRKLPKAEAAFVSPMLLQPASQLPDDSKKWLYELKLDGWRAIALNSDGRISLRSRNDKSFNDKFPDLAKALKSLPDNTVIDGEIVALNEQGLPSFNKLQNSGSRTAQVVFYIFDVMILAGKDVRLETLSKRRELLERQVLPKLKEPIRYLPELKAPLVDLIRAIETQRFEGLVAKRRDSQYEPGMRSGVWRKMRINSNQGFIIGGYTVGNPFDAIVFGYYAGKKLMYAGRTRNGFSPASRAALFRRFKGLETMECPFENLPESKSGRWGQGLTAEKMKDCRWLKPVLVADVAFVEWTPDRHLRHSRFIGIVDKAKPRMFGRNDKRDF